ncbi:MAG TPA: 16S rRNA (cytosine(967)-C(5))-methyltransferase RsmB [Terriglobales bacterium]|nr:16S rRNA (cytosine(967)-C(5))-methyltransferase RsmB [Terriglobales bacterium]
MPVSSARAAAFEILMRIETTDAYASELLHSSRFDSLSLADHGLVTELAMGVLRWRSVLDDRIAEHLTQPLSKLDVEVLTALRIGAYQLLFLTRIPKHAAVNESVELVKQARKRSAAGMVNAVLRKIAKDGSELPQLYQNRGEVGQPSKKSFDAVNFPQLQVAAHSEWLVKRWTETYGADVAKQICAYDQVAPGTVIRLNDARLIEELKREGITLQGGKILAKAFVVDSRDISKTKTFRERRLIIQDEASQLVALLVGKGNTMLDCCAAPGGKTRIIAEQNPESNVIAMELHPHRAALIKKLVPLHNVQVLVGDARTMPVAKQFDRVLVDAPCSGTGTLARNPEIKWRLKPEDLCRLQDYQLEILSAAISCVAPRGRIVYSTCSLEPEENSEVIEKALALNSSFRVLDCRGELLRLKQDGELAIDDLDSVLCGRYLRTIPGVHRCDGFFAAILEKN